MSRQYYDIEGALISLYKLVRQEPEWAQSRIEQTEDYEKLQAENAALRQRVVELEKDRAAVRDELINTPELGEFTESIRLESLHQRKRWGSEHDEGKEPEDWLWLVAYLATKATQASRYGDKEKYLHHIITCGAACLNWYLGATGVNTEMRVGPPVPLLTPSAQAKE